LNAFTGEELFKTTDYVLKYRIEDNTIYTIIVTFTIRDKVFTITKNSIITSFKKAIFETFTLDENDFIDESIGKIYMNKKLLTNNEKVRNLITHIYADK
jgi:hypothetical protein